MSEFQSSIFKNLIRWIGKFALTSVFIIIFSSIYSQTQDTITVRGRIVDGSKNPVSNVSVSVEGFSEMPSVTNKAGEFEIQVISGDEWLNIVPISGFKPKRIHLNNRNELLIYLSEIDVFSGHDEVKFLSQSRLKRNIASSFTDVRLENIEQTSAISIDQYLQARVPGLHVTNRSGDPGSGAFTLMRGINSINTTNQPLYIVDGIPVTNFGVFSSILDGYSYNPLLGININDISKITVYKDPSVTSAFGSKASNGLVVIETLIPSATQTVIEIDLRSGYSLSPSNQIPQLNARHHKTLVDEILYSSGKFEEIISEEYPNLFLNEGDERFIDYQHDTNWQDYVFTNAMFSNVNLNVKGGDEIARYGLSFGYMNSDGIIKTVGYDGYNLRFLSLLNIFTWLEMNAGMSLNYSLSNLKESGKVTQTNPILTSLGKSPMLNPYQYDNNGNQISALALVDELGVSNPLGVINNYEATNNDFNITSTVGFGATLKSNLKLNTNFSFTYNVLKESVFMPNIGMELYYGNEAINVTKGANNAFRSFYNNTFFKYDKSFGKNHYLTFNTGSNLLLNSFEYDWIIAKNSHPNDQYRMLQDGTPSLREIGGEMREWNWLSFYENITYSYRDKYHVTATVSLDGSSRLGKNAINTLKIGDVPYGLFYAGGVGWQIASEPFLRNVSWLEELKLRLTYGVSGNDYIGESAATNFYNIIRFRETVGLYPGVVKNSELSFETLEQINSGIDIALFGNRMSTSIDLYRTMINDMLVYRKLESHFGYDYRPENNGKMQNTGLDISFFLRLIKSPVFTWDIQSSISFVDNKILEIADKNIVANTYGAEIINKSGEKANSFYGYVFKGVYSTTEEAETAGLINSRMIPFQAGDAIFADLSGPEGTPDGIINNHDKIVIGSSLPEHFGGVTNTFTFNRISLNLFLQYVAGNSVFNYVRYQNEKMSGLNNQSKIVLDRWQFEGHETNVPRAVWNDPIGNSSFSSRWIEDGSYLRVKNISLSYSIPEDFLLFRSAKFYISANNVFTFSKYLGYDSEFAYSHSQFDQGIDYGLTPQPRQFIVGMKLGL